MHLTDEQLVALIYDDVHDDDMPFDAVTARLHLDQCDLCEDRMNQLVSVGKSLDQWSIDMGKRQLDTGMIRRPSQPGSTRSLTPWLLLAASLMLFIGTTSFLAGSRFASRAMAADIQREVMANIVAQQQQPGKQQPGTSKSNYADQLAQVTDQLEQSMTSFAKRLESASNRRVDAFQDSIEQLMLEQIALRQDLETLAVNAESEIQLTHDEIRKINELVSAIFVSTE